MIKNHMTHPDSQPQTPLQPEFTGDPLWQQHIGAMAVELAQFEVNMEPGTRLHPVGALDLDFLGSRQAFLPGLGEGHTALRGDKENINRSVHTAQSLVMQMLESVPAGTVKLRVYNGYMAEHTEAFADFAKGLGPTLFEQAESGDLRAFLKSIEARNLDLANRQATAGSQTEPWETAIVMEDDELDKRDQRQLDRLAAASPKYGSIITVGPPVQQGGHVHGEWPFQVEYDKPLESDDIRERCKKIALEARDAFKSPDLYTTMAPEKWTRTAHDGLRAAIGLDEEGNPFEIAFDDTTPHGVLIGPTGGGKSNLLKVLIASLARNYSPDELEIFVSDHKLGVELASIAGKEYLPHAKLVGTKVNNDPELAVAVLAKLKEEIERRSESFREFGVTDYAGLRYADPDTRLPRMLTVIDEVQIPLLSDYKGNEMARLLDYVASQGRAFGVHLFLGSQKVDDVRSLQTINLWQNFAMRIATRQGSVLNRENTAPESLPQYHALVNTGKGQTDAAANAKVNHIVWVASVKGGQEVPYQQEAYYDRGPDSKPPRVFDGGVVPKLEESAAFHQLKPVRSPRILLGEAMTVDDRSVQFKLNPGVAGKNLAVIGADERRRETNDTLRSAILSYGIQKHPDETTISLVCLDLQSETAAENTAEELRQQGHDVRIRWPEAAPQFLSEVHESLEDEPKKPHIVVVFGADASRDRMTTPLKVRHEIEINGRELTVADGAEVDARFDNIMTDQEYRRIKAPVSGHVKIGDGVIIIEEATPSGRELLRNIMQHGPAKGTHVMASFSSVALLEAVLEDRIIPRTDAIGAFVAFGVPLGKLGKLTAEAIISSDVDGHERKRRGFFYDKSTGKLPEVFIPYGSPRRASDDD